MSENDEILGSGENIDLDTLDTQIENMTEGDSEEERQEKKKKLKEQILVSAGLGKNVLEKNIDVVMHESMMPYSEHVIMDRALPRVEDGLKPCQRRILYSMHELSLTPDKPFRKCAKIVGDVLGRYHPHGDSSVYGALVRMAQDFNMKERLVDGHGNFGSIDGDGAAAYRYTEARLSPIALEILKDIDKDTVQWQLNFDDTLEEPVTLPCRFPNLLVNGANGIAVGLATNIPTHNLSEAISACVALIDNPDMELDEIMKYIKGPDFPTGGYIIAGEELKKAYETGKGKIIMRARMHVEGNGNDKKNIVIDEIPYQVNKASLLEKIAELRESKKDILGSIYEVCDESDRNGMRAVIRVKKDADVNAIINYLMKYTDLQTSFGINMVVIADGKPQQLGLKEILTYYVNYQREVVYKRTKFELDQAKERQHILQGLVIAVRNIDEVVAIIKKSSSTSEAKVRLRERFDLSDRQAQAILDMRLARLTSLEIIKLETELLEIEELIRKLTAIVSSKRAQFEVVKDEMLEIRKKYKEARKSEIISSVEEFSISSSNTSRPTENVVISISEKGNVKSMTARHVAGVGKAWTDRSGAHEAYIDTLATASNKQLVFFTNLGNAYKLEASLIPDLKWHDKGPLFEKIVPTIPKGEKPVKVLELDGDLAKQPDLLFFTKDGMVKRTAISEYNVSKTSYQAVKLKEGDELINVEPVKPDTTLLFISEQGMALHCDKNDIPVQGRVSGGVKGMMLADGDKIVFVSQIEKNSNVIVASNAAYAKCVMTGEIDVLARYRKGVKIFDLKGDASSGSKIVGAGIKKDETTDVVFIIDETDSACINAASIPEDTRTSKGYKISAQYKQILKVVVRN